MDTLRIPEPVAPSSGLEHASFRIFRNAEGHWCALKGDGIAASLFFTRAAAIRFADDDAAALLVAIESANEQRPYG